MQYMIHQFKIRKARLRDMEDVFHLSNDKTVRNISMTSDEIEWNHHVEWFKGKIDDDKCSFYIIENSAREFIGQIRFESKNWKAVVSISIIEKFRGTGIGAEIIQNASIRYLKEHLKVEKILAYVKPNNSRSNRSFEKAGYRYEGSEIVGTIKYNIYSFMG